VDRLRVSQAVIKAKSTAVNSTATTSAKLRMAFMGFSFSSDHVDGMHATPRAPHAYFLLDERYFS